MGAIYEELLMLDDEFAECNSIHFPQPQLFQIDTYIQVVNNEFQSFWFISALRCLKASIFYNDFQVIQERFESPAEHETMDLVVKINIR